MKAYTGIAINCIWLSVLIFSVNARRVNDTLTINKRATDAEEPHKFDAYEKCDKTFLSGFGSIMMKTMCKPRLMAVDVIPPSSNILVLPSKVLVNRCDGMCHAKQSCLATETKTVQVMVQQMNLLDGGDMPVCGVVHIEEHVRCKCKCTVMKEDCNALQDYQEGECMCLCMNSDDRNECIMEGKTWNDEKCSCMCRKMKECTTPYVWVPEYCKCAKLMTEDEMNEIES